MEQKVGKVIKFDDDFGIREKGTLKNKRHGFYLLEPEQGKRLRGQEVIFLVNESQSVVEVNVIN